MINLNDSAFDASNVVIFNGGESGLAKATFDRVEPKTAESKEGSPDFKLFFKDTAGGEINIALWYLNEQAADFADRLGKEGKKYKHLVHCFYGKDFQIPPATNAKQLLDTVIALLTPKVKTEVELFCTYGTTASPKQYLQIRSFVPFIRPVGDTTTLLKAGTIDQMTKIETESGSDLLEPSVSTSGLL
jgi:hypothetical protein